MSALARLAKGQRTKRVRRVAAPIVSVERLEPASPYRLRIRIGLLPEMNHTSMRANRWAQAREAADWRSLVVAIVQKQHRPPAPLMRARAIFTRHSSVQPDKAQLGMSFKKVEDALCRSAMSRGKKPRWIVRADVLYDDKPKYLDSDYRWERAPQGAGFITIEIDEVQT